MWYKSPTATCPKKKMKLREKLFLSTILLAVPGIAATGQLSLGTGIDYSSGEYGADVDTDILYVP